MGLTRIEQEKAAACILVQALRLEQEADKLDRRRHLSAKESAKLDDLNKSSEYYRKLAQKITTDESLKITTKRSKASQKKIKE